jgi:hypothetical protein
VRAIDATNAKPETDSVRETVSLPRNRLPASRPAVPTCNLLVFRRETDIQRKTAKKSGHIRSVGIDRQQT